MKKYCRSINLLVKNSKLILAKDLAPALAVLFFSILYAFFNRDFAPLTKWHAEAWMTALRFLRFTVILCFPFFILPKIFRFIIKKMTDSLIKLDQNEDLSISPFKHWFSRPMQGIGIGLIFSTKLIAVLQLLSGPANTNSILISEGAFQIGRFLIVVLITLTVAILLSTLWTFDDIGIRYFNKKDQELKMIGKYVGSLIPFIFGIYGIYNLLANYSAGEAFLLVFKIAVVLYPPMLVFAVLHTYFIRNKIELFQSNNLKKGGIYL